ncbi:hypothetical protein PIN31009_04350 [Pandoraea iniqua]|nr:hypothetical protein PIN31009_04350 [Pandoraea iniqua]
MSGGAAGNPVSHQATPASRAPTVNVDSYRAQISGSTMGSPTLRASDGAAVYGSVPAANAAGQDARPNQ